MSTKVFTSEIVNKLNNNPFVSSATTRRIEYTQAFKEHFIDEYKKGKNPREIFKEAGFDVIALGNKRIERASDRWRQAYNEGKFGEPTDRVTVHRRGDNKTETLRETIERQQGKIENLETEISKLRAELTALRG